MTISNKRRHTPHPPLGPLGEVLAMLFIIKERRKKANCYPTMCMMEIDLDRKPPKLPHYFQQDSVWTRMSSRRKTSLPHDVYDSKEFSAKSPIRSRAYPIENKRSQKTTGMRNHLLNPTMCMKKKTVSSRSRFQARFYAIENKSQSVLALQNRLALTHDVYDGKRVSRNHRPAAQPSLGVGASLPRGYSLVRIIFRLDGVPRPGKHALVVETLPYSQIRCLSNENLARPTVYTRQSPGSTARSTLTSRGARGDNSLSAGRS